MRGCEDCEEWHPEDEVIVTGDDRVFCRFCHDERYRVRFWDTAEARRLEARGDL